MFQHSARVPHHTVRRKKRMDEELVGNAFIDSIGMMAPSLPCAASGDTEPADPPDDLDEKEAEEDT